MFHMYLPDRFLEWVSKQRGEEVNRRQSAKFANFNLRLRLRSLVWICSRTTTKRAALSNPKV
jgi:hypothetical protein